MTNVCMSRSHDFNCMINNWSYLRSHDADFNVVKRSYSVLTSFFYSKCHNSMRWSHLPGYLKSDLSVTMLLHYSSVLISRLIA